MWAPSQGKCQGHAVLLTGATDSVNSGFFRKCVDISDIGKGYTVTCFGLRQPILGQPFVQLTRWHKVFVSDPV